MSKSLKQNLKVPMGIYLRFTQNINGTRSVIISKLKLRSLRLFIKPMALFRPCWIFHLIPTGLRKKWSHRWESNP